MAKVFIQTVVVVSDASRIELKRQGTQVIGVYAAMASEYRALPP